MDLAERTNALKRMPLLADLPHGELEGLAKRLSVETYPEGAEIIKQGASGSTAYFVVSGKCEVRRSTKRGANRRLAYLKAGDFFGELSIIAPGPRSASVTVFEAATVLVLTEGEFRAALRANRSMSMHLVRALAERLQRQEDEFI
ncbi:MAG: cyclic nucleotide-binding domain-containing protein [Archangium sp.]|nr:cyclic nucleotide-binding domain-containing protein [Archangium sp.]